MADDEVVIDFVDECGGRAASVFRPSHEMFWSNGRFEPGETYASHQEFFGRLEGLSRRFQTDGDKEEPLAGLERVWQELNQRFVIRERGASDPLERVGMHLDGQRARLRWA